MKLLKKLLKWWDRKQAEWTEKAHINLREQRKKEQAKQVEEIRSARDFQEGHDAGFADLPLEEGYLLERQAGWIAGLKELNRRKKARQHIGRK